MGLDSSAYTRYDLGMENTKTTFDRTEILCQVLDNEGRVETKTWIKRSTAGAATRAANKWFSDFPDLNGVEKTDNTAINCRLWTGW